MQIYLVGGAVRDQFLKLPVKDKDWLVVGATPKALLAKGFVAVGRDFPVFLHPKTKEEYALARTEKKSGQGYTGFICDFSPDIKIEEDLERRDLTINAMALDDKGNLIDPFGGQNDLNNKQLRHVSAAFTEDPLRVLRVARFAARFHHLGFQVAPETVALMRNIAESGELNTLTPERVWQEWHKALITPHPEIFIKTLRDCGALAVLFPEIDCLFGIPQPEKWHPEIDTGLHTLMVCARAAQLSEDPAIRFAAQLHDLGKGLTPIANWPRHVGHEKLGLNAIQALCDRFRVPTVFRQLAFMVCQEHTNVHKAGELRPETFLKIFDRNDCWRKPERVSQLALCCQADHQGRTGFENTSYPQGEWLTAAFDVANSVDIKAIPAAGHQGGRFVKRSIKPD